MQRSSSSSAKVTKPTSFTKKGGSAQQSQQQKKANPFDLKYAKNKFDVLNKKMSLAGRPSESKAKSQLVREKTLLNQIKGRRMVSKLADKRIDKSVAVSSGYEAAMAQRGGSKKKNLYDLVGENDETMLTHGGLALEKMNEEELDDELLGVEEDLDYGDITKGLADPTKTKAEVMREVIAKSKFHKAERQRIRDENDELRENLDADFDEHLRGSLEMRTRRDRLEQEDAAEMDEYDSLMKDISFQPRAAAADPLSPEERAKKNLEKQQEAEKEKAERMHGLESDGEGEEFMFAGSNDINEGTTVEPTGKFDLLLEQLCYSKTQEEANERYSVIIKLLEENQTHVVDLGKAIRRLISKSADAFAEKLTSSQLGVFPDASQVLLLKLIGAVFSTSDYHHVIATPATLLSVCYLQSGRVSKPRHLWIGLEICQVLLSYQAESKRYIPEVFGFLASALHALGYPKNDVYYCRTPLKPIVFGDGKESNIFDCSECSKDQILSFITKVLQMAVELYSNYLSFPEIFGSFCEQLHSEEALIKDLEQKVQSFKRKPLTLQNHKPIPLPQLEPELEDDRLERKRRSRTSAQDAAEEVKHLKAATKKEMKGAKRELRKDAAFMAKHQRDVKTKASSEYKEKMNLLYGSIGNGN